MLTFPRTIIRQFHKVLKQSGIAKSMRNSVDAGIHLIADQNAQTLLACNHQITVWFDVPGFQGSEDCNVPISCLTECSEKSEGNVTFCQVDGRVSANWIDRDVPIERHYEAIDPGKLPAIPPSPKEWSENPTPLRDALREAMVTTDLTATRYATNCLQLDGKEGQIAATDSLQVLIQSGFFFPWEECLLIPNSRIFDSVVLPRDRPIEVGKTEHHVHFRIGPWQIAFAIQTEGRYPDIARIIPDPSAIETTLNLDLKDARFLVERLAQLPEEDSRHHAVTIDLNGSVAIRARQAAEGKATELILNRSGRIGNEIRIASDRKYLKRAIDLGFSQIGIPSKHGPVICRDDRRQFIWALLEDAAIPPSAESCRVESAAEEAAEDSASKASTPTSQRRAKRSLRSRKKFQETLPAPVSAKVEPRNTSMPKESGTIPAEADLINQLLELRSQLHTIEQSIVTIARHLRARRKQQRLMKATLESLKQLQTLNV